MVWYGVWVDAGRAQPYCLNPLLVARLRVSAAEDVHRTLLQGSTEPQGSSHTCALLSEDRTGCSESERNPSYTKHVG